MKTTTSSTFSRLIMIMLFGAGLTCHAQDADYGFVGETVYLLDNNQDTLNSGLLLESDMFTVEQIGVETIRYDSDTIVTNRNGVDVLVQRLFDVYYPLDVYSLAYSGGDIDQLPVMMVFHAGQGDKQSIADYAYQWALRGYIAVAPSYRSDRLGVGYCHTYSKSIYLAVQDISAVVRTFSYLYDDSQLPSPSVEGNILVDKPIDGHSIFYAGKSWGGTSSFHAASRLVQGHWEDYLGSDEPYIVNGSEGSIDIGDSGPLHSTGRSSISGYEMPYDRIKGAICRTAAIFSEEQLDYSISPNKVPICFIIGSCDKIIPYVSRTSVGADGLCDANLTYPDGEEVSDFTIYGPQYVSDIMAEANVYNEIITFCGGGHDTNGCVDDIIEGHGTTFVTRILSDNYVDGEVYDAVYRYQFENYSNQCCDIGEDYEYLQKCSCGDENPFEVIDLEFIDMNGCDFFNECGIGSICDLEPLSDNTLGQDDEISGVELAVCGDKLCIRFSSSEEQTREFSFYDNEGRKVLVTEERVFSGINNIPVPDALPRNRVIVMQMEGFKPVQFFLRAL